MTTSFRLNKLCYCGTQSLCNTKMTIAIQYWKRITYLRTIQFIVSKTISKIQKQMTCTKHARTPMHHVANCAYNFASIQWQRQPRHNFVCPVMRFNWIWLKMFLFRLILLINWNLNCHRNILSSDRSSQNKAERRIITETFFFLTNVSVCRVVRIITNKLFH